jgi:hypothetical protein|tara:strand:+ start:3726 stop:3905 length:180 start_codon:yes stop_codon:yes gene_type:complete
MKKIKIIGYFLLALLALFIIQGIFFGIMMFSIVLKLMVIAGGIAGIVYLFTRKNENKFK